MNAPMTPPRPEFYDYRFGSEPVAAMGRMRAFGTRILCRAILDTDWHTGEIKLVLYNANDAVAFEIISVGAGVADACRKMGEECPRVGQHCDVRSVAGDRVNAKDPTGRYWLVDVADVAGVWEPVAGDDEALIAACADVRARGDALSIAKAPTGEIEFVPGG